MSYTRKTSDILTSHELDYVLEQIKDNSEVAKLLLKKRHPIENLVENHINYISISNSDKTKISYLTTERSQNIIESSPYGASADELWSSSRRFHAKPGAFISKLFKNIHPKDVEIFSTLFRNIQSKINLNFKVISGHSIREYYHIDSYYSETGSLGNSCMKYDSCQDYLDLYVYNKDLVQMLIVVDNNNKLIGRALLWNTENTKIMDRIYTINDENFQFYFKKWADENGYWYKKEQRWNNTLYFETKGKVMYKEICFDLKKFDLSYYPYMDTFKFIDLKEGKIYNYQPDGIKFKTISSADGQIQPSDIYSLCDKTKTYHSSDNIVYVPNLGMRVCSDVTVYSDVYNLYILREEAFYNPDVRDWVYQDNDLNNTVLIEKRKTEIKSNNKWLDLISSQIEIEPNVEDEEPIEYPF